MSRIVLPVIAKRLLLCLALLLACGFVLPHPAVAQTASGSGGIDAAVSTQLENMTDRVEALMQEIRRDQASPFSTGNSSQLQALVVISQRLERLQRAVSEEITTAEALDSVPDWIIMDVDLPSETISVSLVRDNGSGSATSSLAQATYTYEDTLEADLDYIPSVRTLAAYAQEQVAEDFSLPQETVQRLSLVTAADPVDLMDRLTENNRVYRTNGTEERRISNRVGITSIVRDIIIKPGSGFRNPGTIYMATDQGERLVYIFRARSADDYEVQLLVYGGFEPDPDEDITALGTGTLLLNETYENITLPGAAEYIDAEYEETYVATSTTATGRKITNFLANNPTRYLRANNAFSLPFASDSARALRDCYAAVDKDVTLDYFRDLLADYGYVFLPLDQITRFTSSVVRADERSGCSHRIEYF